MLLASIKLVEVMLLDIVEPYSVERYMSDTVMVDPVSVEKNSFATIMVDPLNVE